VIKPHQFFAIKRRPSDEDKGVRPLDQRVNKKGMNGNRVRLLDLE
jgi:hypothetical protein